MNIFLKSNAYNPREFTVTIQDKNTDKLTTVKSVTDISQYLRPDGELIIEFSNALFVNVNRFKCADIKSIVIDFNNWKD